MHKVIKKTALCQQQLCMLEAVTPGYSLGAAPAGMAQQSYVQLPMPTYKVSKDEHADANVQLCKGQM